MQKELRTVSEIPRIILTAADYERAHAEKLRMGDYLAMREAEELAKAENTLPEWMKKDFDSGAPITAFQRQLELRGITKSAKLGIFFQPDSIGLFPEFIESLIFETENALGANELLPTDFIKTTIEIDSGAAKVTKLSLPEGKKKMKRGVEGAPFAQYSIEESDDSVNLRKFGFSVRITDEARRRETVGSTQILYQEIIANEIYRRQVSEALDTLLDTGYTRFDLAAAALTMPDIYRLMFSDTGDSGATANPTREPDLLVTASDGSTVINGKTLFTLAHFTDPTTGYNVTQPKLPPIYGKPVKFYKSPDGSGPDLDGKIVGIYTPLALRRYIERGSQIAETARIINGQWNQFDYSLYVGFYRFNADCVRVLEV